MLRNISRQRKATGAALTSDLTGSTTPWRRRCLSRDPWFGLSIDLIDRFLDVLMTEDGLSGATCFAYRAELHKLDSWMQRRARCTLVSASDAELRRYLVSRSSRSAPTLSSALRAMRRFYAFVRSLHCREDDPAPRPVDMSWGPDAPRSAVSRVKPGSSVAVARELRDRLIGSLVAATGLRTTDVLDLRLADLHLDRRYIMVGPLRRARMVLLSVSAVELMRWFLEHSRPALLVGRRSTYVFPCSGSCGIVRRAVVNAYGVQRRR